MTDFPKIISVDDHVIEPPSVWQDRLAAKHRAQGPRIVRAPIEMMSSSGANYFFAPGDEGPPCDWWFYDDVYAPTNRLSACIGMAREDITFSAITYDEMRPGCYERTARLADMDQNWVDASLCFPTFPRFCGQTFFEAKDRDLALLCVRAYNDWMVDEWCGGSDGRLIPLCLIPLWDADFAAAEVRRNAERGVRAVAFSELPSRLGLPSIHDADRFWDPFFAACAETGTVVCMHIGSSSLMTSTSDDAPLAVATTLTFNNACLSLVDYLLSGLFVRFPDLVVAYSEGEIGWIPFILERTDDIWTRHRWTGLRDTVPEPPSSYFRTNVYGCFFSDAHGLASLDEIGFDRITFETDYPHSDSTWPQSREVAQYQLRGLDDEVVHAIVRGNAARMLGLDR